MSDQVSQGNPLFPIFVKLDQIQTLVVGGGNVGLEKLEALLKNDPNVKVKIVAPEIRSEIIELADKHAGIRLKERKFKKKDLKRVDLAILATDQPELHKKIKQLAEERHLLVNVADTPDLCDFYLGSTVKKGDLKIGISTNGKSPTFAKRFREILEETLPEETNELLANLKSIRDKLTGDFNSKVKELNKITSVLKDKKE
ncbi:bifunctional precorrin-2 dehydrogenase/sirohydrochlorin ferrochelatase [Marinoscillum sp. MHG1-6]|uniref:precorrin-2 dehydrogenase/sirohydrochlorin ferrochelatase family protein n=1 Tax=Marinoscillum sp. MHG1-6 TaxID=2959627 RepID=UPI002158430F|nr:bifunctional precorrin-2 dehydrogenase/sirohydrochlorin ferrochelatase [Marinoscillum sp. MHG1-6]